MIPDRPLTASCACGKVELTATGRPIVSAVCYCADCREGARQIEALPGAGAVSDPDGGTAYILYRKDRIACSKGAALLKSCKLRPESATNRVVATCCQSAMFMNFDKGPFWVSAYRARFRGDLRPCRCGSARDPGPLQRPFPATCRAIRVTRCGSW